MSDYEKRTVAGPGRAGLEVWLHHNQQLGLGKVSSALHWLPHLNDGDGSNLSPPKRHQDNGPPVTSGLCQLSELLIRGGQVPKPGHFHQSDQVA